MVNVYESEVAWTSLTEHLRKIETLEGVMETLEWDESTHMPTAGSENRGAQQALLSGIRHRYLTDERIEGWLAPLEGASDPVRAACFRNLGRTYRQERRVPSELVEELARAESAGFAAWIEAKKTSSYATFLPKLRTLLDLTLRRADKIDPNRHPYEVMLEQYDPGTSVDSLRGMFARLRDGLTPLLAAISSAEQVNKIEQPLPIEGQRALSRAVATALGYDFFGGRLDHAEHPFTCGLGKGDVRITTHLSETNLLSGLGATIHEAGHALYEQGLPYEHAGTTVAEAASHGLHESQSRFWENFIGRSQPFCRWLVGEVEKHLPGSGITADTLYRASNRVERGLRRVEADEVTYNLHVIVRFELELALFERTITVDELPEAWNAKYQEYLSITPDSDATGVLQDVHWSSAAFGYFPSYTLGNLYAASLGVTLEAEEPELWSQVERGELGSVLAFLRDRVHRHGHVLEAPEIILAAVGERDHVEDFLAYLWGRHGKLYGVSR